ncbi:hypothetical protein [Xanthomonas phage BUDD]|nr:hypothetical protein [Xanthomonas phage BUDD]
MPGINQDAINLALSLKKTVDESVKVIVEQLQDQTIPLDERWAAYKTLCKADLITDVEKWGDGFVDTLVRLDGDDTSLYDNFWIERHETTYFVEMFDRITDDEEYTPESIIEWQEKVLNSGDRAFVFDW